MTRKYESRVGERFGRLEIIGVIRDHGIAMFICLCDCGSKKNVHPSGILRKVHAMVGVDNLIVEPDVMSNDYVKACRVKNTILKRRFNSAHTMGVAAAELKLAVSYLTDYGRNRRRFRTKMRNIRARKA